VSIAHERAEGMYSALAHLHGVLRLNFICTPTIVFPNADEGRKFSEAAPHVAPLFILTPAARWALNVPTQMKSDLAELPSMS